MIIIYQFDPKAMSGKLRFRISKVVSRYLTLTIFIVTVVFGIMNV